MKKIFKSIALASSVGAGSLLMGGCANFSGEGNEFEIEAVVTDPGSQSLQVRVTDVLLANGEAGDWFDIGDEHRIHDNCDCHGIWNGRKTYGTVYDLENRVIEPDDVAVGSCMVIIGKIRDDSDGKFYHTRPVFDKAQIVPCEE